MKTRICSRPIVKSVNFLAFQSDLFEWRGPCKRRGANPPHFLCVRCVRPRVDGSLPTGAHKGPNFTAFMAIWSSFLAFFNRNHELSNQKSKNGPKGTRHHTETRAKHRFKLSWASFCVFLRRFSRPAGRGVHGRGVRGEGFALRFYGVC